MTTNHTAQAEGVRTGMIFDRTDFDSLRHPTDGNTTVFLVRHGQTEGNARHLFVGSTDVPLDEVGERQAIALGKRLEGTELDRIVSSPLLRARQTADHMANVTGTPVQINPGLREIDFGDIEGRTIEWFQTNHPELAAVHADPANEGVAWPNGESRASFNARVLETFVELLRQCAHETIALVCHGDVIGAILSHIQGGYPNDWARFAVQNCSITHLEISQTLTRFHLLNDSSHLDEVQIDLFSLTSPSLDPDR